MEAARCLSNKQIRIYGESLAAIVKKANALVAADLPTYPRKRRTSVSARVPERVKVVKTWRDRLADRLELDPTLLFNKALMTAIAIEKPANIGALQRIGGIHKWQVNAFGNEVIRVLNAVP